MVYSIGQEDLKYKEKVKVEVSISAWDRFLDALGDSVLVVVLFLGLLFIFGLVLVGVRRRGGGLPPGEI